LYVKRNKPIYYTKVFWFSPELNGNGDPGSQGIELDAYPTLRSLVIGDLKFNTKDIYITVCRIRILYFWMFK
jgi:hypothetical protein